MERYLIETTLFDGNEYYICKGFPTKGNTVSQEFKKYYPEYKVQLSKVDYEEENCWQWKWDMAWDMERAANSLFNFLNYKIKYFPDETFYEWYVYVDCKYRCLLVEQKEEGISKAFYHVYENNIVVVAKEKDYRKITIYSKDKTVETMFGE